MRQKFSIDREKLRNMMSESPNIDLLADRLMRIKLARYESRKIFDLSDIMVGLKDPLTEGFKIEPFEGGIL